jgi:hypothetical protein
LIRAESLAQSVARINDALRAIEAFAERAAEDGRAYAEVRARSFSYGIARTTAALLLLEHAAWSLASGTGASAMSAAMRWCARDLAPLESAEGPVPSPMLIG